MVTDLDSAHSADDGASGATPGKDSASPRYIHTCLEKIINDLYPDADLPVLKSSIINLLFLPIFLQFAY